MVYRCGAGLLRKQKSESGETLLRILFIKWGESRIECGVDHSRDNFRVSAII